MEKAFLDTSLWRLFWEIWWRPILCISDAQRKNKKRHPTRPSESTNKKYLITIFFEQTHLITHTTKQMKYTCWMFGVFFVEQRFFSPKWPRTEVYWNDRHHGQIFLTWEKRCKMLTIRILNNGWLVDLYSRSSFEESETMFKSRKNSTGCLMCQVLFIIKEN